MAGDEFKSSMKKPTKENLSIEEIIQIAKQFSSLKEFKASHRNLYWHVQYKKQISLLCEMANLTRRTPNQSWDYKKVLEVAKKCRTRSEFIKKYTAAYMFARQNQYIDRIYKASGLSPKYKRDWTMTECAKEAKKYKTRSDFFRNSPAYHFARRRGWLEKITRHMKAQGSYTLRKLYAFEHPDKSVYVGLTYNYDRRYEHHMKHHEVLIKKKAEIGHKFIKLDVLYPAEIAAKKEQELIDSYLGRGWTILNVNKAGSLGGTVIKWDFESCRAEARKYKTRDEFRRANPSAVVTARKRGWMDAICSHMNYLNRPWTDRELADLAKIFATKKEFRLKESGAYQVAAKRGLLDGICSHMTALPKKEKFGPRRRLFALEYPDRSVYVGITDSNVITLDRLLKKNKTLALKNLEGGPTLMALDGLFEKTLAIEKQSALVKKYQKNGWTILNHNLKWTLGTCKSDAKKYETRTEWKNKSSGYSTARARGWLDECCEHMGRPTNRKWSDADLLRSAKSYRTRKQWEKNESGKYQVALKRGRDFFSICCAHMKKNGTR